VVALLVAGCLATASAQPRGKKEYAFRGKVESVDVKSNTMRVAGENVPGWMAAMTMVYKSDKPEVVKTLKAGDEITAKVYEGDFATLYDIKVAPPHPRK
jgi:Cu/Ag efflux protein CusF